MRLIASIILLVTALSGVAYSDIIRQNVRTLSKSGSTGLNGAVTLSEGSGITLTQAGQNITVSASGTSGAIIESFVQQGGVTTQDPIDGVRRITANGTITSILASAVTSTGSSGSVTATVYYGPTLSSSVPITLSAGSGPVSTSSSVSIGVSAGDLISVSVPSVTGYFEDLTIQVVH